MGVMNVAIFKYLSYEIHCFLYFYGFKQVQAGDGELWINIVLCIYGVNFAN